MQNLLRTLTASQVKSSLPESELKLLLSAVKETRRAASDAGKLADAFYDSLEGLLVDLRMVTMDNRDAEAFLKPVSKTEVPDYYDIISTPMDLQTMLKKVKQRQYKSKKEFKDDLDLIWSNCFTYNATEVSAVSEDPTALNTPTSRGTTSRPNRWNSQRGAVEIHSSPRRPGSDIHVSRQPHGLAEAASLDHPLRQCASRLKIKAERLLKNITDLKERADPVIPGEVRVRGITPRINGVTVNGHGRLPPSLSFRSPSPTKQSAPLPGQSRKIQRDTTFPESPALVRSPAMMATFVQLDKDVDTFLSQQLVTGSHTPSDAGLKQRLLRYAVIDDEADGSSLTTGGSLSTIDGDLGMKRKLNGFTDDRPRKRARTQSPVDRDVVELWWDAMRSDEMLGNGLPSLVHSSSDMPSVELPSVITDHARRKRTKKKQISSANTMLFHMNNNIRTLRRVRTTHAKYSSLIQSAEENGGFAMPPVQDIAEELDDVVDERPWKPPSAAAGLELGAENADDCLHWMGSKVLEHTGFQGASKQALDVLASVTSEYLFNVGRTIRFLCDRYGNKMTAEEIILHTLFESGITRVGDLERYIKDDVVRYGGRLADIEKKLASVYQEATTEEAWDDDALFRMDNEEEDGEFVTGNFAESFGEDFLGLKELGIADEFGLASLSIPKRLLKGKVKGIKEDPLAAKPHKPPPPFPPPPPFIPLDSTMVDNQIGLLKPFYQTRISEISASVIMPPPAQPAGLLPPSLGGPFAPAVPPPAPAASPTDSPVIILPDDAPSPSHAKIGPLGTVNKATPAANAAKKKSKAKPSGPAPPPPPQDPMDGGDTKPDYLGGLPPLMARSSSSNGDGGKKGKGAGSPSKKKAKVAADAFPPVVMASA
ncbi:Transcriptional activator spt7 [Trametes pubescens]|uniref:Transcriptional activator spt7 n=1 Tax=Trametes pubescens TaxID=154538 RepID=A0A1M2VK26_TRAPU|nr:Transcriptional activator spt7 [Trametes pubescens]